MTVTLLGSQASEVNEPPVPGALHGPSSQGEEMGLEFTDLVGLENQSQKRPWS